MGGSIEEDKHAALEDAGALSIEQMNLEKERYGSLSPPYRIGNHEHLSAVYEVKKQKVQKDFFQ